MPAPVPLPIRRLLMAVGMASFAFGTWLGLARLGWSVPLPSPNQIGAHGPLMVCGFLGTMITLERAVALGSRWGYAAPVLAAVGALVLPTSHGPHAPVFILAGSIVLVAMFAVIWRRQPALFIATMALGALAWVVGNALWLTGTALVGVVYWWLVFLVLTIAGERLELNRVLRPTLAVRAAFMATVALLLVGVAASMRWPEAGIRILGAGLLGLSVWLIRHDVARRTVHQHGLTRYIALTLLAGYGWLGFGGLLALVTVVPMPSLIYDAALHALFLGFVISMVFGHAPIIFPAVMGRPLPWHGRFYVHVVLLHLSLVVRIAGDLVGGLGPWRVWGGLLNGVALAVFLVNLVASAVQGMRLATPAAEAGASAHRA